MAYPIQLFDFQTPEGLKEGNEFIDKLSQSLTFGPIKSGEKINYFHKWSEVPDFLTELGNKNINKMLGTLSNTNEKTNEQQIYDGWVATVGVYGRKNGTVIKRSENILYRLIINLGSTEIYYLYGGPGDEFQAEPVVLPNGYALLCSPAMIDNVDIKVNPNPIRKNLDPKLVPIVSKIRERDYIRTTIVLDLPLPFDNHDSGDNNDNNHDHDDNHNDGDNDNNE